MGVTERVLRWQQAGERDEFRGHGIHVAWRDGDGPLVLLLHGFPSSSYDWRHLFEADLGRPLLAFDFLGFGLSDKPRDHEYTLHWQADLAEEMVRRYGEGRKVFVVGHDMGTSVATELLARDIEGNLEMSLAGVLLFNGSIVLERASPTPVQRLLRSRLGPIAARLSSERVFRHQFGSVFSAAHPLTDEEAEDQWSLICHNGGRTLGHELIAYMDERVKHATRWHGAIRDWTGNMRLIWGLEDPVATTEVLEALRELRPKVPVRELDGVGHYPQLEVPERFEAALREALPPQV